MPDNPHFVVLGAGSIGCYLGGLLMAGGAHVTFIGRARYQSALKENGLTLTHFERAPLHISDIDFQTGYDALKSADVILLCTKSQDTAQSAEFIKSRARPNVQIVSFQNGIRNLQTLKDILPRVDIVPAIVPFNVTPGGPGLFHCGTAGALVMADTVAPEILTAFKKAGQAAVTDTDILAAQWAKMIVNLKNALNVLSGRTLRASLMQRDYRRALSLCVQEALNVARANGVEPSKFNGRAPAQVLKVLRLPDWLYKITMNFIVKIDAKARSSMLDDLEGSRAPEIDYLQGEIIAQAQSAGTDAPYNAKIYDMTLAVFKAGLSPKLTGAQILAALQTAR